MDVNARLISEGLAWAYTRFSDDYAAAEAGARTAGVGVWQGQAEPPWNYRANRCERAVAEAPGGCPIKGSINSRGERIYHRPWSPWYDRTIIIEAEGQRWFCDEAEVEDAGWRPGRWR